MSEAIASIRAELETILRTVKIALEKLDRIQGRWTPSTRLPEPGHVGPGSIAVLVRDVLPRELLPKLTVVDQGDGVVAITAQWLGREDWGRVNEKVKQMGGRWIRAGKDSRWEVPVPGA